MSVAIGTSAVSAAGGYLSRASLDAEVARYQKQLTDCVNCPSSKTPEGKANIQDLSNKISADQARIKQIETAAAADDPNSPTVNANGAAGGYTAGGAAAKDAAQGGLVNLFA